MLDKPASALRLRERLLDSERLMEETGCYDGITELTLRNQDPLKFETLHTKLRAYCVSAREMARRISASPGVREVGEMVVAIYTPEGDAIALSNGIMVHVHTMSRFIKWMIRNGYEENPRIREGDIFANNDAFIGTVQVPDVMDVVPIFHEGTLVGWAGAVCHELEAGGITPGGDVLSGAGALHRRPVRLRREDRRERRDPPRLRHPLRAQSAHADLLGARREGQGRLLHRHARKRQGS